MASRSSAISATARISARADVASCALGDGAALLDLQSSTYYSMNAVASAIWELIQQPATMAEICDHVADRFELGGASCEADVVALIDELLRLRLVDVSDGPAD